MPLAQRLVKPLRARDDDSASEPYSDELGGSSRSPSVLSTGSADGAKVHYGESDNDAEDQDDGEPEEDGNVQTQLSKVTFGALARAQASMNASGEGSRKRKRGNGKKGDDLDETVMEQLRARLKEMKEGKRGALYAPQSGSKQASKPTASKPAIVQHRDYESGNDSEEDDLTSNSSSAPDESASQPYKRKSKHAPASQTSSKPVSRARAAIQTNRRKTRDPRFDSASHGSAADAQAIARNYAFLHDYRASEIAAMKTAVKTNRHVAAPGTEAAKGKAAGKKLTADEAEQLKIQLKRLEDKERETSRREREAEVLRARKREERDAVKQGKKPFYLKRSEQKKLVTTDRFEGLKSREKEKALARRRKKVEGREKKKMPGARRGVEV